MTIPLQFGFGEEYVFWKMFRGFGLLQQYIYGLVFVMLLYDLVTAGFDNFALFQQFGVHHYDNKAGLLLVRLTTCEVGGRNRVFDVWSLEFI